MVTDVAQKVAHLSVRKLVSVPKKRLRVKVDYGQTEEAQLMRFIF